MPITQERIQALVDEFDAIQRQQQDLRQLLDRSLYMIGKDTGTGIFTAEDFAIAVQTWLTMNPAIPPINHILEAKHLKSTRKRNENLRNKKRALRAGASAFPSAPPARARAPAPSPSPIESFTESGAETLDIEHLNKDLF